MAQIKPDLLAAISRAGNLKRAQVYARIKQTAAAHLLPRDLAAIKLAADLGVTINRYATSAQLTDLRQAGSPVTPPTAPTAERRHRTGIATSVRRKPVPQLPNQVFVVHGRDRKAREAMFAFLRALGIKPLEWSAAVGMTKKPAPYVGDVLETAFARARAVVVLLTPDDLAYLREDLRSPSDPPFERRLTGQARPNVLFEAGMAFASHPDRTVLVQLGTVRPFSDIAGRHIVHMANSAELRQDLGTRLANAGCDADRSGTDWLSAGDFSDPDTRRPGRRVGGK